ncbi:protein-glutamate O-methyltransferase CheR [Leptolyngbya sp. FACHB-261]|uniref:CheR family methyltransferase n=1 Tax=Leptolyngbya sp. FACHB-261 TaxID=2692806 RepID=UPI00168A279D|nr:protein-glutamate O-methyltransferase CheR [Leptolyngbya sp. FACHB-261]MBD2100418.1 protein-glutamate O-methyltransferase CheR [Leptolyngbya sp. FACHB-261]
MIKLDPPRSNVSAPFLETAELEDLLIYLKRDQQIDLTGYKRPALKSRILARMQRLGVENYRDYRAHFEQQPKELSYFLDTVFINFTRFFRDRLVWDYLANQAIPQIIANKAPHESIRVWSVGCASGEETYSLAIVLAEALGIEQFQQRVRLFGTDVDPKAVLKARRGYYSAHAVEAIPTALREKYFECTTDGYLRHSGLRRSIFFRCHDLIHRPPFLKIDLLVCRNTLIYFRQEAQTQALLRFNFSLRNDGFLLLGQAENLVTHLQKSLFTPVERQVKIFKKIPNSHRKHNLFPIAF